MKKTPFASLAGAAGAALLALASQQAFAQSSVTLYGIADAAVRVVTNTNKANDTTVALTNGPITNSRWGLKGSEDLGNGLSAIFRLENGFFINNGQLMGSNGTLFNRMSYVGLASNQSGAVTLGNQNTPLFDMLGSQFDPLTVGDYQTNAWIYGLLYGNPVQKNSVKYSGTFGGLSVEAMYSFGGVAGSIGTNSMYGATATYAYGPLLVGAGFQQDDNNQGKYNVVNLGAIYSFTHSVKAYLGWLHSQDNTGMVDLYMANANSIEGFSPAANYLPVDPATAGMKTNRIDDGLYVGASWQVISPLTLTFAGYYDHARGALASETFAGSTVTGFSTGISTRYSATLIAEYSLSKRTEVYGEVDYMRGSGAAQIDFPGRNNQTGVTIGLRNIF